MPAASILSGGAGLRARARGAAAALALAASLSADAARAGPPERAPLETQPVPDFVHEDPLGGDPLELERPRPAVEPAPAAARAPAAEPPRVGPRPPPAAVEEGEALAAVEGVREEAHRLEVRLEEGLALARVEQVVRHRGPHPAEVRYRLAVPPDAVLRGLEVCLETRCRRGAPAEIADRAWTAYEEAVRSRPPAGSEGPPRPVARAEVVDDARGRAIVWSAAPVPPRGRLVVRVEWLAAAPLRGGEVRLRLPGRGADRRAANAEVHVSAPGLLAPTAAGAPADRVPAAVEPWLVAEVRARAATGAPLGGDARAFPCAAAGGRCARLRVAGGPRPKGGPRRVVALLDVSPSTDGPARPRVRAAAFALLAAAPAGSTVEAHAFAAGVEAAVPEPTPAERVALRPLDAALVRDLGSATRFDRAWAAVAPRVAGPGALAPLVVVVGDGGVAPGEETAAAFAAARAAGVEVAVVDVGDDATDGALVQGAEATGGAVVRAADEAALAVREGQDEALVARLGALFSPKVARGVKVVTPRGVLTELGALPAGEERVWEGALPAGVGSAWLEVGGQRVRARAVGGAFGAALAARARGRRGALWLAVAPGDVAEGAAGGRVGAASCPRPGPPFAPSGVSGDDAPVALAERCLPPDVDEGEPAAADAGEGARPLGKGVPAATVLELLRQRVVPLARQCFRRDRVGRADYAVRAVFEFRLEAREVLRPRVTGPLTPALRACLLDAVEHLVVPAFDGAVDVRYPVYTARETPPRAIELAPDVAAELDRALAD